MTHLTLHRESDFRRAAHAVARLRVASVLDPCLPHNRIEGAR